MDELEKEEEWKKAIVQVGKQLSAYKTCPNKGALVKLLKQATLALPELKQSESLKSSVKPLSDSLFRVGLLDHKDKDVRILVGTCLCEVIRILAPNPDFSHSVFRDIFLFLLSMFGELDDTASPYFSRKARLLETVAKLRFYLVMLDIGCEDLVLKMFKIFFSVVRDDHPHFLINSMASIITSILEEKVETDPDPLERNTSQSLLDVILQNVIKERKGVTSASFQLAVSVIKYMGEKLERYISQFLTYCILNREAINSAVKESYHEIILEVFQIAPQILLSVIPNLTNELLTDQVDVRIRALNLIRKLLALHGQHVASEYPHLFIEFLSRFSDKSAEVRLAALSCAKALYLTGPSGRESVEIISAIQGRLLDHDDKVRVEAVNVVCDITKANLNFKSSELVTQATERLRDKKVSVRSKALKKLVELYHEYCTRCAEDSTLHNVIIEEIPCKFLMLCYDKHCPDFRLQSMELLLADLFPAPVSIEERAKHWIFLFSRFKPPHIKALKAILSQKRRLQDGLKDFLDLCDRVEENGCIERESEMEALVGKMSSCFPDPAKANDCFQKLKELKDNRIVRLLQKSLSEGMSVDSETMKDGCWRELGDRKDLSEFFRLLSMKCSFNIFGCEHVHYIIDCLSSDEASKKHLINYQVQLLLTIISVFPSLLRGSEKQFQLLLIERVIPFNEQLLEILAREGQDMSIKLSDIYSFLEKICLEGTRAQAKLAVSAIAALADTSEQFAFSRLCKALVSSLYNGCNTPTVLQSIACIAQHSVPEFEAQEKAITNYIAEEIFHHNDVLASKELDLSDETTNCCASCKLKIFGLKALVRSFLPHKQRSLSRPISFVLDIIQQMLQKSGYFVGGMPCEDDAFIRLAAAKSVLRLSKKWDLHISPEIFHLTILTAKDHSPEVRGAFARKIHKLLNNHSLPCRYACAFCFVALDSLKDLRTDAMKYLEDFIRDYGKGAQTNETGTMQGPTDHPAYLVVHLIHVLAHDSNFPDPYCQDEEIYAQVLSPLFVAVQALVSKSSVDTNSSPISNASAYLWSIFHVIKKVEDVVDVRMTAKLHLLAEVGISILDSLNTLDAREHTPRLILLPSSLYRSIASEMTEASPSQLDTSFVKNLVSWLKIEVSRIDGTATHHSQQLRGHSSQPSGSARSRHNRSNPKSVSTNHTLTNKTKKKTNESHAEEKEQHNTSDRQLDARVRQNEAKSSTLESVVVQENSSAENGHEVDAQGNMGSVPLPSDPVTVAPSLSQKEISVSSRDNDDQAKILDANKCSSNEESLPKNRDIFAGKHSRAVKRTRRREDASGTSASEVINLSGNNRGRRTRRQKV